MVFSFISANFDYFLTAVLLFNSNSLYKNPKFSISDRKSRHSMVKILSFLNIQILFYQQNYIYILCTLYPYIGISFWVVDNVDNRNFHLI